MRLALKLTLALVLGVTLVLVVQASLHVRRVAGLQEQVARDELARIASTLAEATGALWVSRGEAGARAFVARVSERRAAFSIALGPPTDAIVAPHRIGDDLAATVPVEVEGRAVAVIALRRTLDEERAYVREVVERQLGTTAALALVAAAIALVVGGFLIARPVTALIAQARRVARGDLEGRVELTQRDELGRLARELGAMTEQLARSRTLLGEQRRARAGLQEQLRHADRLSTVGKLASGIAHELGTPLNVVSGRAQLIEHRPGVPDDVAENAHIIGDQAARMAGIIRELLDFARRHRPALARVDLGEVVTQATTLIEPIAEGAAVSIHVDVPEGTEATIDAAKTLQVLTNLMMNAIQAMPDGGRLTITARERMVSEPKDDHAEPGAFVVLSVEDRGLGIAADDLDHVFEPFFTTKRAGRGTGLGLYICHGIVREQQGWIEVESEPGRGSRFDVYLPSGARGGDDG